jgi:hypothetical protein
VTWRITPTLSFTEFEDSTKRQTPNVLTPDKDARTVQKRHPNEARKINRALGEAQPSEMVERHRREHLAGD